MMRLHRGNNQSEPIRAGELHQQGAVRAREWLTTVNRVGVKDHNGYHCAASKPGEDYPDADEIASLTTARSL